VFWLSLLVAIPGQLARFDDSCHRITALAAESLEREGTGRMNLPGKLDHRGNSSALGAENVRQKQLSPFIGHHAPQIRRFVREPRDVVIFITHI
jgi:hypothetical protein